MSNDDGDDGGGGDGDGDGEGDDDDDDDDDGDDDDDDTAGGGAPGHAEPELRAALHARPPPGHRGHHAGHQGQVRTLAEEFLQSLTLFLIILFPHFMFQVTATERLLPDCERKCLASE